MRTLSSALLNRNLFKIKLTNEPLNKIQLEALRKQIAEKYEIKNAETRYFFAHGEVTNKAYVPENSSINILSKTGELINIADAVDLPNIKAISKIVKKYYLCFPKNVYLPMVKSAYKSI